MSQKKFFRNIFGSSIKFGQFWSIFAYFEAKYLQNGSIWRPLVFCGCFISILSHFWPSFIKIFKVVGKKMPKTTQKIHENWSFSSQIFSLKTKTRQKSDETGKEIYRRFWISNQIFSSIYRSWDIGLSLDTTFAIFGQNLNFVDEYLENGNFLDMRFSRGAQKWLVLHSDQVSSKSLEPFLRKSQKTVILTTFLYFLDDPKFFWIIRLCHFLPFNVVYHCAKFQENP